MWTQTPQGITPAQATSGIHFGYSGPSESQLRPAPTIGDAVQKALAAVKQVMEEKRRDEIANQLLAKTGEGADDASGAYDKFKIKNELQGAMVDQRLKAAHAQFYEQGGAMGATAGKVPVMGPDGQPMWVSPNTVYNHDNKPDPHEGWPWYTDKNGNSYQVPPSTAAGIDARPPDPKANWPWHTDKDGNSYQIPPSTAANIDTQSGSVYGKDPAQAKVFRAADELDQYLQNQHNLTIEDVINAKGQHIVSASGKDIKTAAADETSEFRFIGKDGQEKKIPFAEYNKLRAKVDNLGGPAALGKWVQYSNAKKEEEAKKPSQASQARPATAQPPTATDSAGNKIMWNGTAWVPMQ